MAGVPSTRLQHAEFIAVRVSEYVPVPARLRHRHAGQLRRSQRNDTAGLGIQVSGAQTQVEPVLPALGLGHLLQEIPRPPVDERTGAASPNPPAHSRGERVRDKWLARLGPPANRRLRGLACLLAMAEVSIRPWSGPRPSWLALV